MRRPISPIRKRIIVFACAALVALILFSTTEVTERHDGYDSDGVVYAMISSFPLLTLPTDIVPPFCYRILTPKIASLLPGVLLDRFRMIALGASMLSLFTLYMILRRLRFSDAECALGVLLYAGVFWSVKFSFYSPAYIDHVTNLFLLLIIYCTVSERFVSAIVLLALSVLQKESLSMFSFFVAAEIWQQRTHRSGPRTWLLAAAAIIIPFACQSVFHRQYGAETPAIGTVIVSEAKRFLDPAFWPVFLHAAFSGLGLLPVLLVSRYRPWLAFLRQRPAFLVYLFIAGAALLGGIDKSRLFTYALPGVLFLSMENIHSLPAFRSRRALPWLAVLLAGQWFIGNCLTPIGTFGEYLAKLVPEHSLGLGGTNHLPYLYRDVLIAAVLFGCTLQLVFADRAAGSDDRAAQNEPNIAIHPPND